LHVIWGKNGSNKHKKTRKQNENLITQRRKSRAYQWIFMEFNSNGVVNIFVWGNTCLWGIGHYVKENENFERISFNWGQLVLCNKMIIN